MLPQASAPYLYQRARAPRELELADIPWLRGLEPHERDRALADLKVVQVNVGELLCRVGRPVTYWFGVIEGLLKMSNDSERDPDHVRRLAARRLARRRHRDQA